MQAGFPIFFFFPLRVDRRFVMRCVWLPDGGSPMRGSYSARQQFAPGAQLCVWKGGNEEGSWQALKNKNKSKMCPKGKIEYVVEGSTHKAV